MKFLNLLLVLAMLLLSSCGGNAPAPAAPIVTSQTTLRILNNSTAAVSGTINGTSFGSVADTAYSAEVAFDASNISVVATYGAPVSVTDQTYDLTNLDPGVSYYGDLVSDCQLDLYVDGNPSGAPTPAGAAVASIFGSKPCL